MACCCDIDVLKDIWAYLLNNSYCSAYLLLHEEDLVFEEFGLQFFDCFHAILYGFFVVYFGAV